jgi:hypothetical protein
MAGPWLQATKPDLAGALRLGNRAADPNEAEANAFAHHQPLEPSQMANDRARTTAVPPGGLCGRPHKRNHFRVRPYEI